MMEIFKHRKNTVEAEFIKLHPGSFSLLIIYHLSLTKSFLNSVCVYCIYFKIFPNSNKKYISSFNLTFKYENSTI